MAEAPIPLYDKDGELRAWFFDGTHVFDMALNWIAYVHDGHAFSVNGDRWVGPVRRDGVALDPSGKVLLWSPHGHVSGEPSVYRPASPSRPPRPSRPVAPGRPPRPNRPPRPSDGWSEYAFEDWSTGNVRSAMPRPTGPREIDPSELM